MIGPAVDPPWWNFFRQVVIFALGVGLIGMGASTAVGRNPGAATPILVQAILSTAFAEGIVFFAIFLGGK